MTKVGVHHLLSIIFLALSWSATAEIYVEHKKTQDIQPSFIPCDTEGPSGARTFRPPSPPVSYSVVCDAGSSGTKLKIYRVNRTVESTEFPRIDLVFSKKFEPSIDTFLNDKNGLKVHLTTAMTEVKTIVPSEYYFDTNVYLLATAGLRFLKPVDSMQLLDDIIEVLDSYKIKHFNGRENVGILSGEEEGVFSWIALNYLLGNFAKDRPDNETVGLLEMGGGSTQIAFIPNTPIYDGEFQITIDGRSYDLYVHSYLLFGINAVNQWVTEVISQKNPNNLPYNNPCMLKGDIKEIETYEGALVQLSGSSDPAGCQEILEIILKPETGLKCEPKPCAIGNVYQPSVDESKFYATQGFVYAPLALGAVGPDQVLNLDLLRQEGFKHCQRNLSEAAEANMPASVASSNCLMGIYTPTLFNVSYGFPLDTTNIKVTSKIGNNAIEWSLGIIVMDMFDNKVTRRRR